MLDDHCLLPLLTVVNGPMCGASFRLVPGRRTIGRGEGADIVIDDRRVSRRHATVDLSAGRALLCDAGSTNGTWLNDRRIAAMAELCDGDRLRVGSVELRFFDPGSAATDPVGTPRYVPPPRSQPHRDAPASSRNRKPA